MTEQLANHVKSWENVKNTLMSCFYRTANSMLARRQRAGLAVQITHRCSSMTDTPLIYQLALACARVVFRSNANAASCADDRCPTVTWEWADICGQTGIWPSRAAWIHTSPPNSLFQAPVKMDAGCLRRFSWLTGAGSHGPETTDSRPSKACLSASRFCFWDFFLKRKQAALQKKRFDWVARWWNLCFADLTLESCFFFQEMWFDFHRWV